MIGHPTGHNNAESVAESARMKKLIVLAALMLSACAAQTAPQPENPQMAAWKKRAEGVTIVRDDWGVPHIYAKTDADVVFGLMFAQAETAVGIIDDAIGSLRT